MNQWLDFVTLHLFLRLLISPLLFFCVNVILAFIFRPKRETFQKLALQNIMTNRQRMLPLLFHSGTPVSITGHTRCLVCKSSQWNTCPQCNLPACSNFHFFSFTWTCLKNILKLQMSALQILAFVSGLAGLCATIGATVSNEWRATSRASSVITATWVLQGLWNNCAGNAIGAVHCRPHHTILQLQGKPQGYSRCSVYMCSHIVAWGMRLC